ncbi:putative antimicrobial peptide-like [Homarus americanus]|uniref:Putative antimicrobial peptide-like n=1 Tax=Homarus americanus TaxID=6706 RepID=A0A8J5MVW8_HOMAM|nr:putative antimicrobial peptide-like [Homarus americanus]
MTPTATVLTLGLFLLAATTLTEAKPAPVLDAVGDFVENVGEGVGNFFEGVGDFFSNIFSGAGSRSRTTPVSHAPPLILPPIVGPLVPHAEMDPSHNVVDVSNYRVVLD